ncbi:MAG: alginate lyase family protein, partial [Sphingomonas sp.]
PDGSQPLEIARTKPFNYSLFNLDLLAGATQLLARYRPGLWAYRTAAGSSVAGAVAFMAPFIADRARWPFAHDVEHFYDLPVRQPSLLFAGLALDRRAYLDLWQRLDGDPLVPEIVRNFPLRQPIFWI